MIEGADDPRGNHWTKAAARIWLVAIAVVVRVVVLIVGHPLDAPDTRGYRELATRLASGSLAGYGGLRTPGYPALMALLHQNTRAIWIVQLLFGVLIALAVFEATYTMCRRVRSSFAAGLLYAIAPHALVYESYMLTESTATFLLVAAFLVYVRIVTGEGVSPVWYAFLLGILVGCGVLTRPMQLILLPVFAIGLATWDARWSWRTRGRIVAVFASPALVMTLGWCSVNAAELGSFTLSTIGGRAMLGATTSFIERAGPSYQDMVAAIVPYRDSLQRATGSGSGAVWLAYDRLKSAQNVSDAVLSRRLLGMSLSAAVNAPGRWLRAVAVGWMKFWLAPGGVLRSLTASRALWVVATTPYVLLNMCFLALSVTAVVVGKVRHNIATIPGFVTILVVVIVASLTQAIAEGTGGTRYAIPFEPLFFIALAVAGTVMMRGRVRR
jgi:4-amino-4-deoxy-L-arabinose transferase-like glycosyltransferase